MTKFLLPVAGFLALNIAFLACSPSGEEAVKKAENDVFAIHDEVMPKLDDMMRMRKKLRQRIAALDSTAASGSASATLRTGEEQEQARRLLRDLTEADSLMMNWMTQYKNDTLTKLPSAEALRYLEQQKDKISDVKTKINTSLAQSRQYLDK
ncbi:viral A-type inclusion protein [Spirosoma taeanense]|uniref:Viral A-type inclusion protein n=1 Tax=Spirosoma taeanense TaxID=2735870 RepID=A0A6M5Y9P3_9BACT|nr:viral A-type inclusion protein [Spirosoma taeanense]QJW90076.1 viral A-type inclusion protein [Spirosoma taeanense]